MPWHQLHDIQSMGNVIGHPNLEEVVNDYIAVVSLLAAPNFPVAHFRVDFVDWLIEGGIVQQRGEFQRCSEAFFMGRVARHGSLQHLFQAIFSSPSVDALQDFATLIDEVTHPEHFSYKDHQFDGRGIVGFLRRPFIPLFLGWIFNHTAEWGEGTLARMGGELAQADTQLELAFEQHGTREHIFSYGPSVVREEDQLICLRAMSIVAAMPSLLQVIDCCLDAQELEDMRLACMMGQHVRLGRSSQLQLLCLGLLMQIV